MEGSSHRHGSARASLKAVLLHGSLDIWVHDARSLPDKGVLYKKVGDLLGPRIVGSVADKVSSASMTSDPCVTVQVSTATVARTYVVPNSEDPVWAQNFVVPVGHEAAEVQFAVKDNDVFGGQVIGAAAIPAEQLLCGDKIEGVYPLLDPNGKPCAPGAVLRLSIQYTPVAHLTAYHRGVTAGPDSHGVPNAYFPLRRGMRVTLYQDAHVTEGCLPDIRLDNGDHRSWVCCGDDREWGRAVRGVFCCKVTADRADLTASSTGSEGGHLIPDSEDIKLRPAALVHGGVSGAQFIALSSMHARMIWGQSKDYPWGRKRSLIQLLGSVVSGG